MSQRGSKCMPVDGSTQIPHSSGPTPYNWYLMMFSPATIHVLPFDPHHGNDNARVYAGKNASKPERAQITFALSPVPLMRCYASD